MRICAQNPIQPEFSLCGDAFDIARTEDDAEDFEFAAARGERVTCYNCRRAIAFIYEIYTPNGRVRKRPKDTVPKWD